MKQTGEKLRTVREDKGLSIHEISLSLKINSKVLKAIEEGDTTNLPAKTFLRGFVQSYANYLNMDTTQILNLFQEEMGSTRPQPILNPVEAVTPESPEANNKPEAKPKNETAVAIEKVNAKNQFKAIAISGVMVVLAFLIYIVNAQVERYTKEAQVVSASNDEDIDDLSPVESTSPAKEASKHLNEQPTIQATVTAATTGTTAPATTPTTTTTSSSATSAATPTATPVLTQPHPSVGISAPTLPTQPAPAVKPQTIPKVTTTPPPLPTTPPTPTTPSNTPPTPAPPPVAKPLPPTKPIPPAQTPTPAPVVNPTPPRVMNVELIVEALEPLEIQYATNPEATTFSKIQLKAEQVHTFKSKNGLTLNLSNGGAANLILNGKDLGVPGKQGQSIKLKY
ncbi:MAG TPA: helix-turn-helix domain-containing protein [Pseudobdellovibrionaceae bacterium]|nr:helix-turn-helix domain-containing protein [Pseudobdellovibrionaceae bacterium]